MSETFPNPLSANEAILQNMLGANNEIREPQSPNEALLKQILEQGGAGCLAINTDEGGVLDKTWQDIIDAVNADTFAYIQEKNQPKGSPLTCSYHIIKDVWYDEVNSLYSVLCYDGQYFTAQTADGTLTREHAKPANDVLTIHYDTETYTLDKTYQTIFDAVKAGAVCQIIRDSGYYAYIQYVTAIYDSSGTYYVEALPPSGSSEDVEYYYTDSPNGYPVEYS